MNFVLLLFLVTAILAVAYAVYSLVRTRRAQRRHEPSGMGSDMARRVEAAHGEGKARDSRAVPPERRH